MGAMPSDSSRKPQGVERAEVIVATRVLGNAVSVDLVRFMATRDEVSAGFFWRDVRDALPQHPESNIRRQLAELEDAGVVTVDVPAGTPRGQRRGVPVKFYFQPERLTELFAATQEWVTGGPEKPDHPTALHMPTPASH